jgi:hypothetical protein
MSAVAGPVPPGAATLYDSDGKLLAYGRLSLKRLGRDEVRA